MCSSDLVVKVAAVGCSYCRSRSGDDSGGDGDGDSGVVVVMIGRASCRERV